MRVICIATEFRECAVRFRKLADLAKAHVLKQGYSRLASNYDAIAVHLEKVAESADTHPTPGPLARCGGGLRRTFPLCRHSTRL